MKLKFLGYTQSKGTGTNQENGEVFDFDSVTMDCVTDMSAKGKNIVAQGGQHYKKVKFKACDTEVIFGGLIKEPSELSALCGQYLYVDGVTYSTKTGQYISAEEIRTVD